MRIVAGTFGSRKLHTLDGNSTRPTSDKIRGAIYSRIGPYFDGGVMLDLFGGSGAMGFEALSRGMDEVYFGDLEPKAIAVIKANAAALGVMERSHIHRCDYRKLLSYLHEQQCCFDFIYVDPPYRLKIIEAILIQVEQFALLKDGGSIVCESLKEDNLPVSCGHLVQVKESLYGITKITYYTRRAL
ncbi:MAG: 16S rRNA (guanine(966)-N(2))-methyltransferase RsmD [Erysipelotrichaceae bacterium]|nr:16S rRNA (guanine(966)-N(2))-methyltransferase RsmD [Erysipelotrichaceae bacterium]MCI9312305.1 16S rRNA (guanine(966)-N(2))-methyltransferase RsmD [Erysipelotrichaceae bacterium]